MQGETKRIPEGNLENVTNENSKWQLFCHGFEETDARVNIQDFLQVF